MIEKNEKSGELMEVKEQAKTVRKHPERMIVRIWLVLALICLLAGLIAQYTFRLKEPLFLHYSQSAYLGLWAGRSRNFGGWNRSICVK